MFNDLPDFIKGSMVLPPCAMWNVNNWIRSSSILQTWIMDTMMCMTLDTHFENPFSKPMGDSNTGTLYLTSSGRNFHLSKKALITLLHAFCFISNTFISNSRLKFANFQNLKYWEMNSETFVKWLLSSQIVF